MNQTRFALGTFDAGTGPFPGLVVEEVVFDTRDVLPHATTAALLQDWDAVLPVLAATALAPAGEGRPVSASPGAAAGDTAGPDLRRRGELPGARRPDGRRPQAGQVGGERGGVGG